MIKWFELPDVWEKVKAAARTTIRKEGSGKYCSNYYLLGGSFD